MAAAVMGDSSSWPPGFRFHPTDEELVLYYLKRKICRRNLKLDIIGEVDVYKWEPQELPGLSMLKNGDRQWFFFTPRDRKYPRANRATRQGYWKATGKDRSIACNSRNVGIKKTLVFYKGRAPSGERTDWVMHEYLLDENELNTCLHVYDYYVIYKLFKKSGPGPKNGEQYGAPFKEEDWPCPPLLDHHPINHPPPVNMEDFDQALSQFLAPENHTTPTNPSFHQLVVEDDFIQMDDLLDSPPTQTLNTLSTAQQITHDSHFHLEDGLTVFDLYYDARSHLDVQCTTSQDTGSVNQLDFQVLSYPTQLGLHSYPDAITSFGSETSSYDANSCLVNSTETFMGLTPAPSSGVLYGGTSANFSTESNQNQNQEAEHSQPWSGLWSFVDSIPAAPASAAESALLTKAFQRMSSFGRVRINSRSTISPSAACVNKPSGVGVAGRMKGYLFLSLLAAIFAIACAFFGSNTSFFGKLHCGVDL